MDEHYQFRGGGTRGPLDPLPPNKTRITIRLDNDVLDWFQEQTDAAGGGNYQTAMNEVLRTYIIREGPPPELVPSPKSSEVEPDDEADDMEAEYDFSNGRRGPVFPPPPNTTPTTIRIDNDILEWFTVRIERAGSGSYPGAINRALREHMLR